MPQCLREKQVHFDFKGFTWWSCKHSNKKCVFGPYENEIHWSMESEQQPKDTRRDRSISELSPVWALGDDLNGTFSVLSAASLSVIKDTQHC